MFIFKVIIVIIVMFKLFCCVLDVVLIILIGEVYLKWWWLLSLNVKWGFNVYLYKFMKLDEDRVLYDYLWWNLSILLNGRYKEYMLENFMKWIGENDRKEIVKVRYLFVLVYRKVE